MSLRNTRSICAVAASMSDLFPVCAAFNSSSAAWSQCAHDEVVSFELLETQSWTCRDGVPSASALPAHAGDEGLCLLAWLRTMSGCLPERRCNLRPARQRKDRSHCDTGGADATTPPQDCRIDHTNLKPLTMEYSMYLQVATRSASTLRPRTLGEQSSNSDSLSQKIGPQTFDTVAKIS